MADSEERNLPPTAAKLRKARREGQVAHARDVVTLAIIPVLVWLMLNWRGIETDLKAILLMALTQEFTADADYLVKVVAPAVFSAMVWLAAPLMILAAAFGILLSVVDTQGFVFAAKPLAPDFNRINPGNGLKRIFSARTATEAGFNLIKLAVLAGIAALVLTAALTSLRRLQVCGLPCLRETMNVTVVPMVIGAIALFAVAAVIDFILSRNLFRLEMRMSMTEMKHENKENYGNPEQRRFRKDEGRRLLSGPSRLGLSAATLIVASPKGLVGLRYVPSEIKAPVVVSKARGATTDEQRAQAISADIPIMSNAALADMLLDRAIVGAIIPKETFTDVANEIVRAERRQPPKN